MSNSFSEVSAVWRHIFLSRVAEKRLKFPAYVILKSVQPDQSRRRTFLIYQLTSMEIDPHFSVGQCKKVNCVVYSCSNLQFHCQVYYGTDSTQQVC